MFRDLKRLFKEAEFAVPVPNFGPLREWNSCFRNWKACFLRPDRAQIQELKLRRAVGAAAGLAPWSSERETQLPAPCESCGTQTAFPGRARPASLPPWKQQKIFDRKSILKSSYFSGEKNPRSALVAPRGVRLAHFGRFRSSFMASLEADFRRPCRFETNKIFVSLGQSKKNGCGFARQV